MTTGPRARHLVWLAYVLLMAAALTASHWPPERLPEFHVKDYTLHSVGYFVLAGMLWLALRLGVSRASRPRVPPLSRLRAQDTDEGKMPSTHAGETPATRTTRRILIVVLVMVAYAAFDELTQPMFRRSAEWHDFFADAAGTVAAVLVGETATWWLAHKRGETRE